MPCICVYCFTVCREYSCYIIWCTFFDSGCFLFIFFAATINAAFFNNLYSSLCLYDALSLVFTTAIYLSIFNHLKVQTTQKAKQEQPWQSRSRIFVKAKAQEIAKTLEVYMCRHLPHISRSHDRQWSNKMTKKYDTEANDGQE